MAVLCGVVVGVTLSATVVGTSAGVLTRAVPKPPAEIAPYPPMHWHSWNTFCAENMVNETNMREMADALIKSGMAAAGYDTVNVVCNGWTGRDPVTKTFTENRQLWPTGIAGFADYVHSKGLKLGCYTSPATRNCCGEPGSLGYEDVDMEFFAQAGCDHVMVDWCRAYTDPASTRAEYAVIGQAIAKSSNPNMLYGVWPGGMGKSWKWSAEVGGHYWRTAADILNVWDAGSGRSVLHNFDVAYSIPDIASRTVPGRYTFLDQMVVGVYPHKGGIGGPGLNLIETQSHMAMWVMAASPLLTCNDVRNMTAEIKEILTNPEILAVHKDPAARMATRIDVGGGVEEDHAARLCDSNWSVYGKMLSDGSSAVMVLNRGEANATVELHMEDVGDSMSTNFNIRDLIEHTNLTMASGGRSRRGTAAVGVRSTAGSISLVVQPHGVRVLRLWPVAPPPPPACPAGYSPHPGGFWRNTDPCPNNNFNNCTEDRANATVAKCAAKCDASTGCAAFELFILDVPSSEAACYIFLDRLEQPFTANADSLTCIKAA